MQLMRTYKSGEATGRFESEALLRLKGGESYSHHHLKLKSPFRANFCFKGGDEIRMRALFDRSEATQTAKREVLRPPVGVRAKPESILLRSYFFTYNALVLFKYVDKVHV